MAAAHVDKKTAQPEKQNHAHEQAVQAPDLAAPELGAFTSLFASGPVADTPPAAPPPPRTILHMQRMMGNRATQQMLAQRGAAPFTPTVQRETEAPPSPPRVRPNPFQPEIEAPAEAGEEAAGPEIGYAGPVMGAAGSSQPTTPTIQRGLLDDAREALGGLDPTALISQATSILSGGDTAAEESESTAETEAQEMGTRAEGAAQQGEQEAQTADQQAQQEGTQAEQQAQQAQSAGDQGQGEIAQAGQQGAGEIAAMEGTAQQALSLETQMGAAAGQGGAAAGAAAQAGQAAQGAAQAGSASAAGAGAQAIAGGAGGAAAGGAAAQAVAGAAAAGQQTAAGASSGAAAGVQQAVSGGAAAEAAQGLTCPEADILGRASGLGKRALDALITGADALTGGMASRVANLAKRIGGGLARGARYIGEAIENVASAIKQRVTQMAQPLINVVNQGVQMATNAFNAVRTKVTDTVRNVGRAISDGVSWLVNNGPAAIQRGIARVQSAVGGAVQRVAGMIGGAVRGIIGRLPGGSAILSGIDRLREKISATVSRIRTGVGNAIGRARSLADRAAAGVRGMADRALQRVVQGVRSAAELGRTVVSGIGAAARTVYETVVPAPVRRAAAAVGQFIGEQVDRVRGVAGEVWKGIEGAVCVPLNEIAEPCINQYLPFSEGSSERSPNSTTTTGATSSAITLSSSMAVTIPLAEFGIPGSAEVGRGASVSVRRSGARAYSVSVSGESTIFYTLEAATPAQASVQIDSPVGGGDPARGDAIWQALTGGGGAITPADGGGSTGAGGPTAKAGIKAGQKRQLQIDYGFNVANSTCDLASLAGLLATYGLSGAISAIVPQPFSTIVSATGNAVAAGGWASHITGVNMTNTNSAEASAKVSQPGQGSVSGQVGAESSTSVGLSRQDDGSFRPEASFSQGLNAQLAGEMNLGGLFTVGGSIGASGSQSLTLIYDRNSGLITPSSLTTSIQASLGLQGFNVSAFPAEFIPADAASIISQNLEILRRTAARGNVTVQLSLIADNMQALTAHVMQYLSTAPIEQITWAGVMRKVREGMQQVSLDRRLTVTATEIRRAGISGEAEVNVEGTAVGVTGSVSAERRITHTLYSNTTRMSGPQLNPTPAPTPTPTPTPDPDNPPVPPPGPVPGPGPVPPIPQPPGPGPVPGPGPGPTPPSRKNPLDMSPDEFEADTAAQDELFSMAQETRGRQQGFGHSMIAEARAAGNVSSILKRNERDAFVAGVLEKCRRKGYSRIGEMPDIVRGRFNLDRLDDVNSVVLAITQQSQFRLVEPPVPPREREGVPMGYPRWHIVVEDSNRIVHEWQIGTQATTDVYEQRGINIPPEVLPLPSGMHNDIHDIEYDILKRIQEDHPEIAAEVGIPTFRRNVALASADSGRQGVDMPDKNERIVALHNECSTILRMLVDRHGADIIRKYFKSGSSGGPEES